jgi:hypothetical protein
MLQGKSPDHIVVARSLGDILPRRAGPTPSRLSRSFGVACATRAMLQGSMARSDPEATSARKVICTIVTECAIRFR